MCPDGNSGKRRVEGKNRAVSGAELPCWAGVRPSPSEHLPRKAVSSRLAASCSWAGEVGVPSDTVLQVKAAKRPFPCFASRQERRHTAVVAETAEQKSRLVLGTPSARAVTLSQGPGSRPGPAADAAAGRVAGTGRPRGARCWAVGTVVSLTGLVFASILSSAVGGRGPELAVAVSGHSCPATVHGTSGGIRLLARERGSNSWGALQGSLLVPGRPPASHGRRRSGRPTACAVRALS